MLVKEYRIAMPFSVDEYKIGQLYMIAKHSHEQSDSGEGVEVVHNVPHNDSVHGDGRYTEKRIHLSSRLPYWLQSVTPKIFYVIEKSWNYFPYTETEYTCSFIPKFNIFIKTRYQNDGGTDDNILGLSAEELESRILDHVDIAYDELAPKHYKAVEDPKLFKSEKTGRGPLKEGWRENFDPIMCSYKLVQVSFEVWGLQTKVEDYAHKAIRDILLLGHRQAFAWIDDWFGMTEEDVRVYEEKMQNETNQKVLGDKIEAAEEAAEEDFKDCQEELNVDLDGQEKEKKEKVENGPQNVAGGIANAAVNGIVGLKSWLTWSS